MTRNQEALEIHEVLEFANGLEVDTDEAWRKLIHSQFAGSPARAFPELIQNALDSYPANTPWEDRWLNITTGRKSISIDDYGEGMDRNRLRLLLTLGGTDKTGDITKIGRFGIGFVSIFNPLLGTKKLRVLTRCEGHTVELLFDVHTPDKMPGLSTRILEGVSHPFSTRIEVTFDNATSPKRCLEYALKSLDHYPCQAKVNGRTHRSIWEAARERKDVLFFRDGPCDGFVEKSYGGTVTVLCKYERVRDWSLRGLLSGSSNYDHDLQPFYQKDMPYCDSVAITINVSNLTVTVSRDGFMLDGAYQNMLQVITSAMAASLLQSLKERDNPDLIRANQYVMRDLLRRFLQGEAQPLGKDGPAMTELVEQLAKARVYRLSGRKEPVSLADIHCMRTEGLPVFFSPHQTNIRWVGGAFKHDFIVLPPPCHAGGGAPGFYDSLFGCLFNDVVNLDTIANDPRKVAELAAKGIVAKDALCPRYAFRGRRDLDPQEKAFLDEVDRLLANREVQTAITRHLHMPVSAITTGLIDVDEKEYTVATGLFDRHGKALADEEDQAASQFSNLKDDAKGEATPPPGEPIRLGLCRNHPLIDTLILSADPHRAYYALTFLAHELTLCQRRLVPYSPLYHWVKEQMACDMRRALLIELTSEG